MNISNNAIVESAIPSAHVGFGGMARCKIIVHSLYEMMQLLTFCLQLNSICFAWVCRTVAPDSSVQSAKMKTKPYSVGGRFSIFRCLILGMTCKYNNGTNYEYKGKQSIESRHALILIVPWTVFIIPPKMSKYPLKNLHYRPTWQSMTPSTHTLWIIVGISIVT